MQFDVLGTLRAAGRDGPVELPGGRSAAALAWLVLNTNQPVSFDSLASVLWPKPSDTAVAKARMLVRSLVPLLEPGTLAVNGKVRLVVTDDSVDAWRFERLLREAVRHVRTDDDARARSNLTAALQLWRGEPYPELERATAAIGVIDRLVELRLRALEDLNGIELRAEFDYTLVAELRALAILHPDRPRLRRQLALALYRTDRQIEALDVLREARSEFGDDDADTASLQGAILQHAPELALGELSFPARRSAHG